MNTHENHVLEETVVGVLGMISAGEEQIIDTPKVISAGEELVIENKVLRLEAQMRVDGSLTLRNCVIIPTKAHILVGGKLLIQNCRIERLKSHFLSLEPGATVNIEHSDFRVSGLTRSKKGMLYAPEGSDLQISSCNFYFDPFRRLSDKAAPQISPVVSRAFCALESDSDWDNEIPLLDITPAYVVGAANGKIINCTFRDFPCRTLAAKKIIGSTFHNCVAVRSEGVDGSGVICNSAFVNCHYIYASESLISDCSFKRIWCKLSVDNTNIENCKFEKLDGRRDFLIALEDGSISHCAFDDIRLLNDSYLIEGYGDAWVEHCHFSSCRTSRKDMELVRCCKEKGRLFKKHKEYDIVDDSTCTGLDKVQRIF